MAEHSADARGDLDAEIERLEFDYHAEFVPKNISRNRDQQEPSINWKITLRRRAAPGVVFMTDYMQGIGHVPGYLQSDRSKYHTDRIAQAAVTGKYYSKKVGGFTKDLPKPELRDILYSCVLDSSVLDSAGFEDWAGEFGYDTDSRKAEALYRDCIELALRFKALVGQENLDKLRELFQGY